MSRYVKKKGDLEIFLGSFLNHIFETPSLIFLVMLCCLSVCFPSSLLVLESWVTTTLVSGKTLKKSISNPCSGWRVIFVKKLCWGLVQGLLIEIFLKYFLGLQVVPQLRPHQLLLLPLLEDDQYWLHAVDPRSVSPPENIFLYFW